jgi:multiple sugar transport system permease protein
MRKSRNMVYIAFILPGFAGLMLFYCVPFLISLYYAFIDNMAEKDFVGLTNIINTLKNSLFRQAAGNTLLYIIISVPFSMFFSLLLALGIKNMKFGRGIASIALLFPIIIPSGTIVYFWKILFDTNGVLNKVLYILGFDIRNPGQTNFAMVIITLVFLWKNISYNIVLFWSGLNWIPQIYYEQYQLEGGSSFKQFCNITWVYLSPTTFVVLLMSIINSFKVFKEIYLLYGTYPTPSIYMLQHYMNNQFLSLNMQKLTSAAYLVFFGIGIIFIILFYAQKRITDTYH